jgi:predicted NUDIX family NTP pyrophosphohydrolase
MFQESNSVTIHCFQWKVHGCAGCSPSSPAQSGGKIVIAWAVEGDCDPSRLTSNLCQVEWPPRSGRFAEFPEVDRGGWFSIAAAREHILKSQEPLPE